MTQSKFGDFLGKEDPLYEIYVALVDLILAEEEEDQEEEYDDEYWEQYEDPEEDFENVSNEGRFMYVTNSFNGEMVNGGLIQLFFNSAGNHISEIKRNLKHLGAVKLLEILEKGASYFPNGEPPEDRAQRQEVLSELEEDEKFIVAMEGLDRAYYEINEEYYRLINEYIVTNREATLLKR